MVHFEMLLHFYLLLAAVVGLDSILSSFFFSPTVLSIVPLAKLFSRIEKILLGN